jgi:integrase/recombinase XerD
MNVRPTIRPTVVKPISPLRRRMIDDMTIRNLSPATQRSSLHAVEAYRRYFGRSPDQLGLEDVRAYQVHPAGKGIAWATLSQIVCALRFLYGVTLARTRCLSAFPVPASLGSATPCWLAGSALAKRILPSPSL